MQEVKSGSDQEHQTENKALTTELVDKAVISLRKIGRRKRAGSPAHRA